MQQNSQRLRIMWASFATRVLSRAGENMSAAISSIRVRVAVKCVSVHSVAFQSEHLRLLSETEPLIKVNCWIQAPVAPPPFTRRPSWSRKALLMVEDRQLLPSPPMRPGRCDFPEECLWKSQGGEKYGGKYTFLLPSVTVCLQPATD